MRWRCAHTRGSSTCTTTSSAAPLGQTLTETFDVGGGARLIVQRSPSARSVPAGAQDDVGDVRVVGRWVDARLDHMQLDGEVVAK